MRAESSEVDVLFTLVLIGAFQIINGDKSSESLLQRLAFKDIKAKVQYAIKGITIMPTVFA